MSTFSIFSVAEILQRLGEKQYTGCLHVFREHYSGNLYTNNGRIVAADFTGQEGHEAVDALLECTDFQVVWMPGRTPTSGNLDIVIKTRLSQRADETGRKAPVSREVDRAKLKTISLPDVVQGLPKDAKNFKSPFYLLSVDENKPIVLEKDGVVVGRDPSSDIWIDHPSISWRHCAIHLTPRGLHVMGLHSRNGVFVNKKRLEGEGVAMVGDIFTIGSISFQVRRSLEKEGIFKSLLSRK
jgi:hypothetical protein